MATGIVPYVVDLVPLRAFWGSRDLALLERMQSVYRQNIADNAQLFKFLIDQGAPSLDVALHEIANGLTERPQFASQYAYALELLCAHFGKKQPNNFTRPVDLDAMAHALDPVWDALQVDFSTAELTTSGWPLPLPEDGGLPRGGTVELDEVDRVLKGLRTGKPPAGVKLETMQLLGELRGWFETAGSQRAAIVTFYY